MEEFPNTYIQPSPEVFSSDSRETDSIIHEHQGVLLLPSGEYVRFAKIGDQIDIEGVGQFCGGFQTDEVLTCAGIKMRFGLPGELGYRLLIHAGSPEEAKVLVSVGVSLSLLKGANEATLMPIVVRTHHQAQEYVLAVNEGLNGLNINIVCPDRQLTQQELLFEPIIVAI